jgi:hypothetical protein
MIYKSYYRFISYFSPSKIKSGERKVYPNLSKVVYIKIGNEKVMLLLFCISFSFYIYLRKLKPREENVLVERREEE